MITCASLDGAVGSPNSSYVQYTYTGQKLTQVYDSYASSADTHTFSYDTPFA